MGSFVAAAMRWLGANNTETIEECNHLAAVPAVQQQAALCALANRVDRQLRPLQRSRTPLVHHLHTASVSGHHTGVGSWPMWRRRGSDCGAKTM